MVFGKTVVVYAILLTWTVWIGFPLYWLAIFRFKRSLDIFGRATYLPFVDFTPTGRAVVAELEYGSDAALALTNSVVVAVGSSCIALLVGAMAGYALARFRYRVGPVCNEQIRFFFLGQRLFPVAVLAAPYLIMFRTLHLLDTQLALVLAEVGFGTPFVAWLVRDFFVALPKDIEDSALLDGCSRLQVLRYVVFPLGAPALIAALTLIFVSAWNDYVLAVVVTFSQSITLPLFIQLQLVYLKDVTDWPAVGAVVLVSVIPPIVLGLCLNRFLTRGLSFGLASERSEVSQVNADPPGRGYLTRL